MLWLSFIAGIFFILYSLYIFLSVYKKTKQSSVLYFITGCFALIMSNENFGLSIRKLSACISIVAFFSALTIDKIKK